MNAPSLSNFPESDLAEIEASLRSIDPRHIERAPMMAARPINVWVSLLRLSALGFVLLALR